MLVQLIGGKLAQARAAKAGELASGCTSRRIARVIFAFEAGGIVLLHGFIKKTQKTPAADLDLALKRLKDVQDGEE